jgi:leucyl-tRNA synthetase
MAVPAHDERDLAFAQKFNLAVKEVVVDGCLINSGTYNGLTSQQAIKQMIADFPQVARRSINYKLRDWLISRQRYWGAPIPVVYDPEGKAHLVKEEHLPWLLPDDVDFKPTGESPLKSSQEFKARVEKKTLWQKAGTPE